LDLLITKTTIHQDLGSQLNLFIQKRRSAVSAGRLFSCAHGVRLHDASATWLTWWLPAAGLPDVDL
jgi:hypothetical protein